MGRPSSLYMYLETRDIDETMRIYTAAWDKGVKTTYYLHMKPRHTAEQSTVKVNKSEMTGKKGFGAIQFKLDKQETLTPVLPLESMLSNPITQAPIPTPILIPERVEVAKAKPTITIHGPEDPQDALLCESCQ